MNIRVVRAQALSGDDIASWSSLQQLDASLGSPFFCPQFTQAVAGVRDDVYVAIVEDRGNAVGFFPYQRGPFRTGRPVGGALSDFHGIIAHPDLDWDPDELVHKCGLGAWSFDHLLANQEPFARYRSNLTRSPYIDLRKGFEAFAAERRLAGSGLIKKTSNLRRRLEREVGTVHYVSHVADTEVLNQLLAWKSAQYLRSDCIDVFSYSWTVSLVKHVLASQTSGFAGMLSQLRAGDKLVAVHFGMRSRDVWHYWFPAYDTAFSRYSPGIILLLSMAEAAPGLGIHRIDLGKGEADYKARLATGSTPLAEGRVSPPSPISAASAWWRSMHKWVLQSRLSRLTSLPEKLSRRIHRRLRFR